MYTSKTEPPDDWNDSSVADSVSFAPEINHLEMHETLKRAARKFCGHRWSSLADDIASEAFAKLLEKHSRREIPHPVPKAYVYRVAYNTWVDEMRRAARAGEVPAESRGEHANLPPATSNPEQSQRMLELRDAVSQCLSRIAVARREVLQLSILGHGRHEISRLLSIEIKTVDNAMHRGKRDLMRCLRKRGLST